MIIWNYFRNNNILSFIPSFTLQHKCEQYWNDQLELPYDAGNGFTVVTTQYKRFADHAVRDFTLKSVSLFSSVKCHTLKMVLGMSATNNALPLLENGPQHFNLCVLFHIAICWTLVSTAVPLHWLARPRSSSSAVLTCEVYPTHQEGDWGHRCTHSSALQVRVCAKWDQHRKSKLITTHSVLEPEEAIQWIFHI